MPTPSSAGRLFLPAAYATIVFFPHLTNQLAPSRVLVLCLGAACLLVEAKGFRKAWAIAVSGLLLTLMSIAVVIGYGLTHQADPYVSLNFQRMLVELPIYITLGAAVALRGTLSLYAEAIWRVGIIAAIGATVEQIIGRSVLGREVEFTYLIRDGGVRGLFASEEPLVLGALLCIAVPLARSVPRSELRVLPVQLILLVGIYCTGSRGPFAVALALVVFGRIQPLQMWAASRARALSSASVPLLVGLLWWAGSAYETRVLGTTGATYSTNYRKALYALLPDILEERPLGLGLREIPRGEWLLQTELFGVRDIASTVDSEIVYLALAFGYVGIVMYLAGTFFALRVLGRSSVWGAASCAVFVLGGFLALHAWDTLGSLCFFITGASIGLLARREPDVRAASTVDDRQSGRNRDRHPRGLPSPGSTSGSGKATSW